MGYHVHFGGGPLGLACVYPAVKSSDRRVVIVNRVGKRFDEGAEAYRPWRQYRKHLAGEAGHLDIDIEVVGAARSAGQQPSRRDPRRLRLLMPGVSTPTLSKDQLGKLKELVEEQDVYVMTACFEQLGELFQGAESFSTAVREGQKEVAEVLAKHVGQARPVYVFENKNDFVPVMTEPWKRISAQVIVDRICIQHSPRYDKDRSRLIERVSCESFVELKSIRVINDPPEYWTAVDVGRFGFFEKRKRYMVNCVHTALALLGYSHLRRKHIKLRDQSRQVLSLVLDGLLLDPESRRVIDVFIAGKAMQLLVEEPPSRRPEALADDEDAFAGLVSGGKVVLDRMRAFPDEIGRVLQREDAGAVNAHAKMLDRVGRHVKDLAKSVGDDGRRNAYRSFAARGRPHVREIDRAIEMILDAWGELMKS